MIFISSFSCHLICFAVSNYHADFCQNSVQSRYCFYIWNWSKKFKGGGKTKQLNRFLQHHLFSTMSLTLVCYIFKAMMFSFYHTLFPICMINFQYAFFSVSLCFSFFFITCQILVQDSTTAAVSTVTSSKIPFDIFPYTKGQ